MSLQPAIQIVPVGRRRDMDVFLTFPWQVYRQDPNWVAPLLFDVKNQLNPRKNPFFKEGEAAYWLAMQNGKPVGRIAAIINDAHNRYYGESAGFFGFFEVLPDQAVARALLHEAATWLRAKGMERMLGPVNLDTTHECGLLIEGFDRPPILQMAYNPAYYPPLLEAYGMTKEIDLLAFYVTEEIVSNAVLLDRLEKISARNLQNSQVTIRTFNRRNFAEEVELIRELYNDFMQDNWGFVPATKAEFDFMAETLKLVLIPELVLFAEVNGQPVGLSLSLPDLNQAFKVMDGRIFPTGWIRFLQKRKAISDIRVMLMGVSKPFCNRGIETHFYLQTIKKGYELGFTGAELSWVTERNTNLISVLEKLNADPYKRYRIYEVSW